MTAASLARLPRVPRTTARPAPAPKRPRAPLLMSDLHAAPLGRPILLDLVPPRPPKR
ncbi:MAG: hypothetical protein ACU0BS_06170 [Hasllibacter sp.]